MATDKLINNSQGDDIITQLTGIKNNIDILNNIATSSVAGRVKPDNSTIIVAGDGTLSTGDLVEFKDITDDFNDGTFSANLRKYKPGNYIKKTYNGTTYVAVLAHYNYYRNPGRNEYSNINKDHWTAIVLGFTAGSINSTHTTAGGFAGSDMLTWLKGDCQTAVLGAFGSTHLIANTKILSNGTYNASAVPSYGFSWGWDSVATYAMIPTEVQLLGTRAMGFGWFDVGCENRQFKIFQEKSFMEVLGRDYGQSNNNFNSSHCWERDIAADVPGTDFCCASYYGLADSTGAGGSRGRFPAINIC